jgi:hypothetical protein
MAERDKENFLVTTMNEVAAVFLFSNTIVVVENDGSTSTIDRYNGNFDGHVTLGSLCISRSSSLRLVQWSISSAQLST